MSEAFICDGIRTPIGKYGGGLSGVRTDDLAALALRALADRHPTLDLAAIDDVILGCANQAGEDNRNVARMALLLADYPCTVPGVTVNRLCASGLEAVATAARLIQSGQAEVVVAGGVESMTRAPFVMGKAPAAFARSTELYDTTMGWRFINESMRTRYGVDLMPETAENLAAELGIAREAQDEFALQSQTKTAAAQAAGWLAEEIVPVPIAASAGSPASFLDRDEHPRPTRREQLAQLKTPFRTPGTVTAGNSSGINDGAAALLLASPSAIQRFQLRPLTRVAGVAAAGVEPRRMGLGPVPATRKLLKQLHRSLEEFDVLEFNEAFAVQVLACLRELNLAADDPRVNPQGGAIALGHPLGMSGARLALTATRQLQRGRKHWALCSMCVGVGQGLALALERC